MGPGETFVDGMRRTAVRLGLPMREPIGIAHQDRDASIARSTITDDELQARVFLIEHAVERARQELCLIHRRHHHADGWEGRYLAQRPAATVASRDARQVRRIL